MPHYPSPDDNPYCQCRGNPLRALFCPSGHMTECHAPYSCARAACGHLAQYDFEPEDVAALEKLAAENLRIGLLPPYGVGAAGALTVKPPEGGTTP